MFQELEAMFDGTALQLEVPLNLDPGTRVRVTVESVLPKEQKQPKTFLQNLDIEFELEDDGRWIAEVINLPGVLAYGDTKEEALTKVKSLALRVLADRLECNEAPVDMLNLSFVAV